VRFAAERHQLPHLRDEHDGAGLAITNGAANDIDPVFSPDGTRIAFARAVGGPQTGQYDIYVMDAAGGNVRQLTTEPKDDRYPAWSPDGTKIAFRGYPPVGGAAIFTMNADGTAQTAIRNTGGGDQPTGSPDGTRIAYSGTYARTGAAGQPVIADDIFVQPVNAGNATLPINVTNEPQVSDRYPSWQPTAGSSQILYRRGQASGRELWRVDVNTGVSSNLTVAETNSKGRAASWSPDGNSAAFVSYVDGEGDLEIWLGTVNVAANMVAGARQLTHNAVTDDEPKIANVPAPLSAVPATAAAGAGGGTTGGGTTGGGTLPGGRRALSLVLTVPKQTLGRRRTLRAYARCSRRCSVNVTGLTKMKVRGKNRTLRLLRAKRTIKGNVRARLNMRIGPSTLRSVRSALRQRKRVRFRISATARTTAGEFTPAAVRTLTLRR